jgi:ribonuclease BN (tRNA processing enzyme)
MVNKCFLSLLLLLLVFTSAHSQTQIVLLGTGTPYPDPHASGPATAVVVGKRVFLFDAGVNVMRQINAAGLSLTGPEATFITHLHSDHTLGYPDLILTSWITRRRKALEVFGPPGLRRMTNHLLAAYSEDIEIRTRGLEREVASYLRVNVHEIQPAVIYEKEGVRVTAIRVPHGSWKNAFAYRVDTPDRSILISGDTAPSKALTAAAKDIDVLVHEVYLSTNLKPEDRPGGELWPQYMREFHTSERELGEIAAKANCKTLLLTHIIRFGGTDEQLVSGIRAGGYVGRIVVGKDLERY